MVGLAFLLYLVSRVVTVFVLTYRPTGFLCMLLAYLRLTFVTQFWNGVSRSILCLVLLYAEDLCSVVVLIWDVADGSLCCVAFGWWGCGSSIVVWLG